MKMSTMQKWVQRHGLQCATAWALAVAGVVATPVVHAQAEPLIGQLMLTGSNFCPTNFWMPADGQILSVARNEALFALIGTMYGGDGVTTFALPNLQGRTAVHMGQGPGLSRLSLAESLGREQATLSVSNLPAHAHSQSLSVSTDVATYSVPAGRQVAQAQNAGIYADANGAVVTLDGGNTGTTGAGAALDIRSPALAMTWCIATSGVFPPSN